MVGEMYVFDGGIWRKRCNYTVASVKIIRRCSAYFFEKMYRLNRNDGG